MSFQLLDEIDPSFWSLRTFIESANSSSSSYFQELSFNQLVKIYTASLCLHTLHKDNHYYEKAAFFETPQKLAFELGLGQNQLQQNGRKSIGDDKMLYLLASFQKLIDLSERIKSSPVSEKLTFYQSNIWPNESSISNIALYFPIFNELLPLKKKDHKAESCLSSLRSEIDSISDSRLIISQHGFQQFEEYIESVYKEVTTWNSGNVEIPMTPRKRSFDLVEHDFTPPPQENAFFNTSPLVRVKSQMRKRRSIRHIITHFLY